MTEMQTEDSASINSDDSNESNISTTLKEKLEGLINQESKHSHNYYDLHTKDNYTRLDLENLNNSCIRYGDQKKRKSEYLEELYDKFTQYQRQNQSGLKDRLSIVNKNLEETNSCFYTAYDEYNSNALRNKVTYLDREKEKLKTNVNGLTKKYNNFQQKGKLCKSLMTPKSNGISNFELAENIVIESSLKRPDIVMGDTITKCTNKKKNLEKKRGELKFELKRH